MNTREALLQFAQYPSMTVRDLTGTVRKQVIQIDVIELAHHVETSVKYTVDMLLLAQKIDGPDNDLNCVDVFSERLTGLMSQAESSK